MIKFFLILALFFPDANKILFELASRRDSSFSDIPLAQDVWQVNVWLKISSDFTSSIAILQLQNASGVVQGFSIAHQTGKYRLVVGSATLSGELLQDLSAADLSARKFKQGSSWNFLHVSFTGAQKLRTEVWNTLTPVSSLELADKAFPKNSLLSVVSDTNGPQIYYELMSLFYDDLLDRGRSCSDLDHVVALYDFSLYNQGQSKGFFNLAHRSHYNEMYFESVLPGFSQYERQNEFPVTWGKLIYPKMRLPTSHVGLLIALQMTVRVVYTTWTALDSWSLILYRRNFHASTAYVQTSYELGWVMESLVPKCSQKVSHDTNGSNEMAPLSNQGTSGMLEVNLKLLLTFQNDIFSDVDSFALKVHFQSFASSGSVDKKVFGQQTISNAPSYNDEHFTNINPSQTVADTEQIFVLLGEALFLLGLDSLNTFEQKINNSEDPLFFGRKQDLILWTGAKKLQRVFPNNSNLISLKQVVSYWTPSLIARLIHDPVFTGYCPSIRFCKRCYNGACITCFRNYFLRFKKCHKCFFPYLIDQSNSCVKHTGNKTWYNIQQSQVSSVLFPHLMAQVNFTLENLSLRIVYEQNVFVFSNQPHIMENTFHAETEAQLQQVFSMAPDTGFSVVHISWRKDNKQTMTQFTFNQNYSCPATQYSQVYYSREELKLDCLASCSKYSTNQLCYERGDGCLSQDGSSNCLQCGLQQVESSPSQPPSSKICVQSNTENFQSDTQEQNEAAHSQAVSWSNCAVQENSVCIGCNAGYVLKENQCVLAVCEVVTPFCNRCDSSGCIECEFGYIYDTALKICKYNKQYCSSGYSYLTKKCVTCSDPNYETIHQVCNPARQIYAPNVSTTVYVTCIIPNCNTCFNYSKQPYHSACHVCLNNYISVRAINQYELPIYYCLEEAVLNCSLYDFTRQCTQCSINYNLLEGECAENIPNCLTYNGDTCVSCKSGYMNFGTSCSLPISNCLTQNIDSCSQCEVGYINNVQFCAEIIQNCQNQVAETCLTCNQNYTLQENLCYSTTEFCLSYDSFGCFSCEIGYFVDINKKCVLKVLFCAEYDSKFCIQCLNDFFLFKNVCIPLEYHQVSCLDYNQLTYQCDLCQPETILEYSSGQCVPLIENCLIQSRRSQCDLCQPETILEYSSGQCVPLIENCLIQSRRSQCDLCQPETIFEYSSGQCVPLIENCLIQSRSSQCDLCKEGYLQDSLGQCSFKCLVIIEKCIECSPTNTSECTKCHEDFQLSSNQCLSKIHERDPYCLYFSQLNPFICVECDFRAFLGNGRCHHRTNEQNLNSCIDLDFLCARCQKWNPLLCEECVEEAELIQRKCELKDHQVKCEVERCILCDDLGSCIFCEFNFTLRNGLCEQDQANLILMIEFNQKITQESCKTVTCFENGQYFSQQCNQCKKTCRCDIQEQTIPFNTYIFQCQEKVLFKEQYFVRPDHTIVSSADRRKLTISFLSNENQIKNFSFEKSFFSLTIDCSPQGPYNFTVHNKKFNQFQSIPSFIKNSLNLISSINLNLFSTILPAWIVGGILSVFQKRALLNLLSKLNLVQGRFYDFFSELDGEIKLNIRFIDDQKAYQSKFQDVNNNLSPLLLINMDEIIFFFSFILKLVFSYCQQMKRIRTPKETEPEIIKEEFDFERLKNNLIQFHCFSQISAYRSFPLMFEWFIQWGNLTTLFKCLFLFKFTMVSLLTARLITKFFEHTHIYGKQNFALVIIRFKKYRYYERMLI